MAKQNKITNFYVVGTPIGNLQEMSFRAVEVFRSVDLIYCEDTRRTRKLLNHFEIKKPLKSAPYFKEREAGDEILKLLAEGQKVAYASDAGMPGLSDPGALIVSVVRKAGFRLEVVGGPSALTSFIAGLGYELDRFEFLGFLPAKTGQKERLLQENTSAPRIFFESPHRIQKTLKLVDQLYPERQLCLAKELSKLSECFFQGSASELIAKIPSWKGEWVGLIWPSDVNS